MTLKYISMLVYEFNIFLKKLAAALDVNKSVILIDILNCPYYKI